MESLLTSRSISSSFLRRVQRHDPEAWQRLVRIFGPIVYSWARSSGLQEADAADVMQETFRAVASRIDSFDHTAPGSTFRGWLWTVVRNKIRDHFRSQADRPVPTGGLDHLALLAAIPESPPEDSLSGSALTLVHIARQSLELVRAEFEPRTWQAFWQITVEDQRPADVAQNLGMSVGSVYMAKSRVLKRLREELAGMEEL